MGVAWVCDALEREDRVLIHCQRGVGRSPMLATCVLVARGLDLPTALRQLKQARCRVSPSPPQLQAIMVWVETRARVRAEAVDLSWDELVDIVYAPEA
jgi:protein-tyrosine phosphatase